MDLDPIALANLQRSLDAMRVSSCEIQLILERISTRLDSMDQAISPNPPLESTNNEAIPPISEYAIPDNNESPKRFSNDDEEIINGDEETIDDDKAIAGGSEEVMVVERDIVQEKGSLSIVSHEIQISGTSYINDGFLNNVDDLIMNDVDDFINNEVHSVVRPEFFSFCKYDQTFYRHLRTMLVIDKSSSFGMKSLSRMKQECWPPPNCNSGVIGKEMVNTAHQSGSMVIQSENPNKSDHVRLKVKSSLVFINQSMGGYYAGAYVSSSVTLWQIAWEVHAVTFTISYGSIEIHVPLFVSTPPIRDGRSPINPVSSFTGTTTKEIDFSHGTNVLCKADDDIKEGHFIGGDSPSSSDDQVCTVPNGKLNGYSEGSLDIFYGVVTVVNCSCLLASSWISRFSLMTSGVYTLPAEPNSICNDDVRDYIYKENLTEADDDHDKGFVIAILKFLRNRGLLFEGLLGFNEELTWSSGHLEYDRVEQFSNSVMVNMAHQVSNWDNPSSDVRLFGRIKYGCWSPPQCNYGLVWKLQSVSYGVEFEHLLHTEFGVAGTFLIAKDATCRCWRIAWGVVTSKQHSLTSRYFPNKEVSYHTMALGNGVVLYLEGVLATVQYSQASVSYGFVSTSYTECIVTTSVDHIMSMNIVFSKDSNVQYFISAVMPALSNWVSKVDVHMAWCLDAIKSFDAAKLLTLHFVSKLIISASFLSDSGYWLNTLNAWICLTTVWTNGIFLTSGNSNYLMRILPLENFAHDSIRKFVKITLCLFHSIELPRDKAAMVSTLFKHSPYCMPSVLSADMFPVMAGVENRFRLWHIAWNFMEYILGLCVFLLRLTCSQEQIVMREPVLGTAFSVFRYAGAVFGQSTNSFIHIHKSGHCDTSKTPDTDLPRDVNITQSVRQCDCMNSDDTMVSELILLTRCLSNRSSYMDLECRATSITVLFSKSWKLVRVGDDWSSIFFAISICALFLRSACTVGSLLLSYHSGLNHGSLVSPSASFILLMVNRYGGFVWLVYDYDMIVICVQLAKLVEIPLEVGTYSDIQWLRFRRTQSAHVSGTTTHWVQMMLMFLYYRCIVGGGSLWKFLWHIAWYMQHQSSANIHVMLQVPPTRDYLLCWKMFILPVPHEVEQKYDLFQNGAKAIELYRPVSISSNILSVLRTLYSLVMGSLGCYFLDGFFC